jgi:hypothetical protein
VLIDKTIQKDEEITPLPDLRSPGRVGRMDCIAGKRDPERGLYFKRAQVQSEESMFSYFILALERTGDLSVAKEVQTIFD